MRRICLFALCFLSLMSVRAQRLVPGQLYVHAAPVAGVSPLFYGGQAGVDLVRRDARILISASVLTGRDSYVSAVRDGYSVRGDYVVRNTDCYASGGYARSVAGTRSRSFGLWLGITADAGVRLRSVLEYVEDISRVPSAGFLWGFTPELGCEFFVSRTVSLTLALRPQMHFATRSSEYSSDSSERWFYPQAALRVGWCLFPGH